MTIKVKLSDNAIALAHVLTRDNGNQVIRFKIGDAEKTYSEVQKELSDQARMFFDQLHNDLRTLNFKRKIKVL